MAHKRRHGRFGDAAVPSQSSVVEAIGRSSDCCPAIITKCAKVPAPFDESYGHGEYAKVPKLTVCSVKVGKSEFTNLTVGGMKKTVAEARKALSATGCKVAVKRGSGKPPRKGKGAGRKSSARGRKARGRR